VDEAAVAFVGALGGSGGPGDGAEEFAFFGGFAAGLFAGFGFAVEGLCDGGGGSLLAEGEDFDVEFAAFVLDVEHVADADFAGGLGEDVVGEDAVEVAGFGGLFARLEEAGGPEPFVDASAGHAGIVAPAPLAKQKGKDGIQGSFTSFRMTTSKRGELGIFISGWRQMARSMRPGREKSAAMSSKAPPTAMPTRRKGRRINQISG